MAEADALEGRILGDTTRDEELVSAALTLVRQSTEDAEELVGIILRQRQRLRAGEAASPMSDDLSARVLEVLQRLDTRVSLLERDREDAVPGPKVKLFVQEVIAPIKDSMAEIKVSMKTIAEESRELYEAHKAFIDAEQKRREKEMEERTAMGLVKKYLPLVTLVGGCIALFRVLGSLIEFYLSTRTK